MEDTKRVLILKSYPSLLSIIDVLDAACGKYAIMSRQAD
jgi:hypothetical protein